MTTARRIRMRPEFGFTREGRVFVLATLGIGIGAVNTGNNLLYMVLGLLLGLLLTSGVLSEIALRGVRIERGRPPRAFARAPSLFELEVHNEKRRFASLSFEVGDEAEGEPKPTRGYVQELRAGERTTVVVERTVSRRGVLASTKLRITTRFPFGLLEKSRVFTSRSESLVFPELVPVGELVPDDRERGFDESTDRRGQGTEVIGLREHRENDSPRDVHWRRSAALSRLVVRERSRERDPEVVVALRCVRAPGEVPADFEADVSLAASRAVIAVERGLAVRLVTESGTLARATDRADLDRLLAVLATIDASTDVRTDGRP